MSLTMFSWAMFESKGGGTKNRTRGGIQTQKTKGKETTTCAIVHPVFNLWEEGLLLLENRAENDQKTKEHMPIFWRKFLQTGSQRREYHKIEGIQAETGGEGKRGTFSS